MSDHPDAFMMDLVQVRGKVLGVNLVLAFPRDTWEHMSQDPEARDRYLSFKFKEMLLKDAPVTWEVAEQ